MSNQSEGYSAKLIGVAVPSLSNWVFTEVLRGICDVAASSGYRVLIVDTHYSALEEERMVRTLLAQSLDGLIITGGEQTEYCRKTLKAVGVPLVQMMELLDDPIDMNVGFSHCTTFDGRRLFAYWFYWCSNGCTCTASHAGI